MIRKQNLWQIEVSLIGKSTKRVPTVLTMTRLVFSDRVLRKIGHTIGIFIILIIGCNNSIKEPFLHYLKMAG